MSRHVQVAFVMLCLTPMTLAAGYSEALSKSLRFFDAQRSGKLPADNPISWRGDSCLKDGSDVNMDLTRSFFDSGDHVIFGLPLGYSLTMMAYGLVEYGSSYGAQKDAALTTLRWGTDWLIRAHPSPNEFYVQVADGDADHACWTRPEDMDMPRPSFKVDASHPGSEPAAEAAAALAAASIVFKDDHAYHTSLLMHAQQLFEFADTHRGVYSDSVPVAAKFYKSYSGFADELLWAAAWLHRATSNSSYLSYLTGAASDDGNLNWKGSATQVSWDDKRAAARILLSRLLLNGASAPQEAGTVLEQYKQNADTFACHYVDGGVPKTSAGLPWLSVWSPLQYVTSSSFLIAVYGDYLRAAKASLKCPSRTYSPDDMLAYSKRQADYIMGSNPMGLSYMVGYGSNYPQHVHHRGASIPQDGKKYACGEGFQFFQMPSPNPHVLEGGIVGGPDQNDRYQDARSNFQQAEPSVYTVGPFLGLLARLQGADATVERQTPAPQPSSTMALGGLWLPAHSPSPNAAPPNRAILEASGNKGSPPPTSPSLGTLACECDCVPY